MSSASSIPAQLEQIFTKVASPQAPIRKEGEQQLESIRFQPQFPLHLMNLISSNSTQDMFRLQAAIEFKNLVKKEWKPNARNSRLHPSDRQQIKQNVLALMCSLPFGRLQNLLSDTVCIIGEHDFYKDWPNLVTDMVQKMNSNNFNQIRGVLKTAESIFRKYRDQMLDEDIIDEIKHILQSWTQPMLGIYKAIISSLPNEKENKDVIVNFFECLLLLAEIFYSLNYLDLPEFFEDHLKEFVEGFVIILRFSNCKHVESPPDDDEPDLLTKTKTSVLECINLFTQKYQEEIDQFIPDLTGIIWNLTINMPITNKYDHLGSKSIEFLTLLAASFRRHQIYADEKTMHDVCERIVIPNITLQQSDEDMFAYDPIEYIRRDIEGSDTDTRRRSVHELIRKIRYNYERQITHVLQQKVAALLKTGRWQDKDAAFFIISALTVVAQTREKGVRRVNEQVDIGAFFNQSVLPELQSDNPKENAILKADAIKFVTVFRNQLPKETFSNLMPLFIKFLRCDIRVTHTYAAWAIERFLSIKDNKKLRFTAQDLSPFVQQLFEALFNALSFPESRENEYIMRAIMRITAVLQDQMSAVIQVYISTLSKILERVCKNPVNPTFNHYLFESYATVIRFNPRYSKELESSLMPVFQHILAQNVAEFTPYVFQLMALLLEQQSAPLPSHYQQIFPNLLNPTLWDNTGNVPGIVSLLHSYAKKAPEYFQNNDQLMKYLNLYSALIKSQRLDHEGFRMINTLIEFVPMDNWGQNLPAILKMMFDRLQTKKTAKFVRLIVIFFSVFALKHGVDALYNRIEGMQQGLFMNVARIWFEGVHQVNGHAQRKLCSAALTAATCRSQHIIQHQLWKQFLEENVKLLELKKDNKAKFVSSIEGDITEGFKVKFNQLQFAAKDEMSLTKDVKDTKQFLAQSLNQALQNSHFRSAIQNKFGTVDPQVQQAVASYLQSINVNPNVLKG